nr:MAG TPA: tailspike protein [Bacteriophage sp.]
MNAHNPFDAKQDWTNPYCQNSSNDPMVDALLGNAYHVVRTVYCNLGNLKLIYDFLNKYGMVLGVQSETELKAMPTSATYVRLYGFDNTNKRVVTDYLYVDGDRTGVIPDDPTATGSWILVATSNSDSGGDDGEGKASPPYIPYSYNNGSAIGGETTIPVPAGTVGVPMIVIDGYTNLVGYGFTYDASTLTVTLAQSLEPGDEVHLFLTGTPAVPNNPNVSDWVQINWLYNGGYASGGEQVIAIPYTFESVPAIYKNGERYYAGLADKSYAVDAANQRILLTEPLDTNDRLIVQIGGESTTLIMSDRTVQEVARSANVHENDIILSTNTTQYLNGMKVIYDVVGQKIYGLPTLPTNVYINSVSNGQLTYSPGNITVDLLPMPSEALSALETLENSLNSPLGFTNIGRVQSFAALRTLVPPSAGARVLLSGYYDNSDIGGGEFIARSTTGMSEVPNDDGGVIATVNSNWYWERVDTNNATVEDFGAISYTGDDTTGIADSSDAFQRMFNSLNRIFSADSSKRFVIDAPILLKGSHFKIDLSGGRVAKRTSTKSGITSLIPVFGGYAPANINCVFMATETVRYFQIKNIDIWCNEAPIGDRPVGIYIPSATNYSTENINFRGCLYDIWCKNAWRGTHKDIRGNDTISHSCFYDGTRTNAEGVPIADAQSATSLLFDGYYANSPGGSGFYLNGVDYSNFAMAAVDGAKLASYTFINSNVTGTLGAEYAKVEYINVSGGVVDAYLSTYDDITDNTNYVAVVKGTVGAIVKLCGRFRTQKYRLANVTGSDNVVEIDISNYWNGSTKSVPQSVCTIGNYLDVKLGIGGAIRRYRDGVLQEGRASAPSYTTTPSATGSPYSSPILRVGMFSPSTTIQIPMYRIKEVFPNFNKTGSTLVEFLRIKTTNGNGLALGAIFMCSDNTVVSSKLDNQIQVGSGAAAAVVTAIAADSSNLTITFTGTVGVGAVIELSYA